MKTSLFPVGSTAITDLIFFKYNSAFIYIAQNFLFIAEKLLIQ